ncbi:unnamed protein product [Macrosiphum euphorbiae]|uniref:Uncharacterized protein n=1 Tax=Macrosiphum euphorbiae TaxID=13131 RepID=A0AAV0WAM8_9HEMI|nr:unnamed protein product [Macrosiphum euphorbiae]
MRRPSRRQQLKGSSTLCHMALPNGIAKGDVDFLLAQAIWQSFANWHAKPYPSTVGQDQRKPNGKMNIWHISA